MVSTFNTRTLKIHPKSGKIMQKNDLILAILCFLVACRFGDSKKDVDVNLGLSSF